MAQSIDLVSQAHHSGRPGGRPAEKSMTSEVVERQDAVALARSGKQQVLTRRFGLVSMTGFACGLMCTWEGMLVTFLLGLQNGGPAGLIYGFLVTWLGTLSFTIVLGELTSMNPTAGGQYHWISILAPPSSKRFLSYITGWITVVGWVVGTAAAAFFVSSLVQALMVLNIPGYEALGWQGTLLFWGVLVVCVMLNTVFSKALPAIEVAVLVLHVLGFFAIIIPLLYLAPKGSAGDIFTTFQNSGGWSTQTLSFFIGLNGNAVAFVGTDGAIHMSEEVKNSQKNVARSMILSTVINGLLALAMLLAVLFCMGNVDDAIQNAPNGYPFIAIFVTAVGSSKGATAMASIVIILELCSATAGLAAASRMMWSFARDRGLPGHQRLKNVDRRTTIPLLAVLVVFTCSALIGLINVGSSTAFNAVVSLVLESFYTSYLLACGMLLYRRVRKDIVEPTNDSSSDSESDLKARGVYRWGPWRLRGFLGIANNIFACVYLIIIAFFSYWPTAIPVTAVTMNWSSLVLGFTTIGSIVYYLIWARKTYTGPVVEVLTTTSQRSVAP